MTRMPRGRVDPIEREIELAFDPGHFIPYQATFDFVHGLEQVEAQIQQLIATEPARAVTLYETFLAGCHLKADEIDDSDGYLGQLVEGLFRGWIRARQACGADPHETVARLLGWMDDDPYGFASDLDKEAAQVLDEAGLAAFVQRARVRAPGRPSWIAPRHVGEDDSGEMRHEERRR